MTATHAKAASAAALFLFMAARVHAQPAMIDQSVGDEYNAVTWSNGPHGQVFTVGISGNLVAIEAPLFGSELGQFSGDPRTVELRVVRLRDDTPSLLPEDILASDSTTFSPGTFPRLRKGKLPEPLGFQWVKFDLPPTPVQEGEQLAFLFIPDDLNPFQWATHFDDPYPGGRFYAIAPQRRPIDGLFRTYVVPVPEPRAIGGVALAAIFFTSTRRRTRH